MYECESTGGAEWLLEDTIPLRNVSLPRVGVCTDTQIDLSYLHDTSFMQKKQRLNQVCKIVTVFVLVLFSLLMSKDLRKLKNTS